MTRINSLNISFTDRNARRRGPTSSATQNDLHDELASDLAGLYEQWNNRLKTMTDTLPDGTDDPNVDAFTDGLDGQTLYVKSDATVADTTYWNSGNSRPNTVYEQMAALYTYVDDINESLGNTIGGQVFSAANMSLSGATDETLESTEVNSALLELYNLFASNFILSGTGSPEGVTVANIGALYTRTDGGASSTLYIKESGSGTSAGWRAV